MYEKIDRKVLDSLIDIYKDLDEYKSFFPKLTRETIFKFSDRLETINSFINNYATLYYKGLMDADKMTTSEIDIFVNGLIEDVDILDEKCSNKSILTRLIKIYYEVDETIQELGESTCKEHLTGLINRRNSIKTYIQIFARLTFKKFAKKEDVKIEEIFKSLHGIYPIPYQKQKIKEHK